MNPATQPTTSLPEVPASFLTNEFMQSVANTLDDFDPQALFRPEDTALNFEQDFREWFNPDDLDMK
jgi:collagen type III alpha